MKKEIHKAEERGESDLGWLHSRFSFSFADYYNPNRMGFGALRVLNDDIIEPGKGFGIHSHANMEIITIVTEGKLEHKDSMNLTEIIRLGEIQVMSAGTGITHSEYNRSNHQQLKLFQIWITPQKVNVTPRYDKKLYTLITNKLTPIVSGTKEKDLLFIHQDAKILLGKLEKGSEIDYTISKKKGIFIFVIEGKVIVEGEQLSRRDTIALSDTSKVKLHADGDSFMMVIEVPLSVQK